MKYFAYGSNLFIPWLRGRTPSAVAQGVARLSGYQLRWHKRSALDGSGKCDAWCTADPGDEIWGVVYEIDPGEKAVLDRIEGVDHGYEEKTTTLVVGAVSVNSFFYSAEPESVDPSLLPFSWYHALVLAGARYHKLPETYLESIRGQQSILDHDSDRAAQAFRLLGAAEERG